jgi:DNA polymerase-3 subunit gamma/tau
MSYLVFARKYRPQTFDTVSGQEHVTRTLKNAIQAGRVAHAVLLSGPRGTGKTTVARILAKAMNCINGPAPEPCNICRSCAEITSGNSVDVLEIDGASNNGVENVRDLRDNVKYKPAYSRYKIYIIDEVHMLSTPAFNALLKTLEEPPPHVMFLFATTEPHKIPITILSRCQRHDFKRIGLDLITGQMASICGKEGVAVSEESLFSIARAAGGSMRDALSLLDLVLSSSDGPATDENLRYILGIADRRVIYSVAEALLKPDISVLLDILDDLYESGHNMKELYSDILEHFRNLLVVKTDKNVSKLINVPSHEIDLMKKQAGDFPATVLSQIFDLLYREEATVRHSPNPKLAIEMIFFSIFRIKPVLPIELLIEKIDGLRQRFSSERGKKIPGNASVYGGGGENSKTGISEKGGGFYVKSGCEAGKRTSQGANQSEENKDSAETWERLYAAISEKHPSLAANMEKCSMGAFSGDRLEIEVDGNGFNLSRIKNSRNIDILKRICREFFGRDVEIALKEKKKDETKKIPRKNETDKLINDALNSPLVSDAVEIFRGRMIDAKIL